ncbi:RNA pseudouridylate synthase domain-containing protein 1 [Trichoplax sp. H2]|nr:RNA pseudouridylate synthase domain-containing protein 1 [Trichoplax sp. H2]|eukprot:RDD43590.1 RNA pseudouridylate synthase domain-containing protein 1 [Trichoplax sp. H2]
MATAVKEKKVQIVHQTNSYVIVNKPFDMHINSNEEDVKPTVATQLAELLPTLVDKSICFGFRFVNRLDYATSGLLCIAFDKRAANMARKLFEANHVSKKYLALVRGILSRDNGDILVRKAIGLDRRDPRGFRMCIPDHNPHLCQSPKAAETLIRILGYGKYDGEDITKISLSPVTGRRHQLRVHCLTLGHCIVGDYTYSNEVDSKPYRMMLHSYSLKIPLQDCPAIEVTTYDPFLPDHDPLLQLENN